MLYIFSVPRENKRNCKWHNLNFKENEEKINKENTILLFVIRFYPQFYKSALFRLGILSIKIDILSHLSCSNEAATNNVRYFLIE